MFRRLSQFLLIRPEETAQVGYLMLLYMLIGAGLAFGRASTDALFFKRYGIEFLPLMYIVLAGLMMTVTLVYAAFVDRLPSERLFKTMFAVLGVLLLGNWGLIAFTSLETAYPLYFLLYELASDLLVLHFSMYLSQNLETSQAKRLMALIFAGAQVGAIGGGLAVAGLAGVLGVTNLLLVWFALLAAGMALMWRWHRRHGPSPYYRAGRRGRSGLAQSVAQIGQGLRFARRSELVQMTSLALFCTVIMFYILNYAVNRIYNAAFPTAESLTAFFGLLTAATSALGLITQIFLSNRLIYGLGVRGVNMIFPVTSAISYVFLLLSFTLPAAIFASVNKDALMKAFRNPARNLILNGLPAYMQGRTRALAMGLVIPVALALAGGLLILTQRLDRPVYFLFVGGVAALAYAYFNWCANQAYVRGILAVLREKLFLPDRQLDDCLECGGDPVMEELVRGIQQDDEEVVAASAQKAVAFFPDKVEAHVLPRMERASPALRDRLIRMMHPAPAPRLCDALCRDYGTAEDRLRATILGFLAAQRDARAVSLARGTLASANPRLQAAAIAVLCASGEAEAVPDLLVALLKHAKAGANLAALEVLARHPDPVHREAVLRLSRHHAARVRRAAVHALGAMPESSVAESAAQLETSLHDPDPGVRRAAVAACRRLPPDSRERMYLLALEDDNIEVRSDTGGFIVVDGELRGKFIAWLVTGAGSLRAQESVLSELIRIPPPVEHLLDLAQRKGEDAQALAAALVRLRQAGSAHELVRWVLHERLHQSIDLTLLALVPVEGAASISVIRAGLSSGDRRHIANACEALRHLRHGPLGNLLANLLENLDSGILSATGGGFHSVEEVLHWCCNRPDSWLRQCAARVLPPAPATG